MWNATSPRPAKIAGRSTLLVRRRAVRMAFVVGLSALLLVGQAGSSFAAETGPTQSGVVNLNTANSEELQRLPGVGEVRAGAIIRARKDRGGFKKLDELVEVKGVGPALLKRLRRHVTLQGKTTLQ